ncbi:NACHT domain-containing protein [Pseudomonas frederiksbergensis]|uniref:NACHT domain-containing protein n=1 Tax=Pseudomonas frederiksbergensis TaxID=104087 RepID=UPI0032E3F8D2
MEARKIERIKKLEREVQDFHPLLKVLLSRIPYIRNVEYKQGPNENGADFVLEKYDEVLTTTNYIGVIVKVGKIKQDQTEVERQIEECGMERTFDNGKKKIFLSEIWIVTNDTITENAQQKIHYKYKNTSIIFFDGLKITNLIERYYPEYWTDISIKLGEYIRKIRIFSDKITKNSSIIEFQENINIEQKTLKVSSKIKPDQGRVSKILQVSIHDAIKSEALIFLEGMMGAGKSNLVKRAIERVTSPDVINLEKVVPVGMTYKDYVDIHNENIDEIIVKAVDDSNTDPEKHTYLLIIDGLDEVPSSSEAKLESLQKISQFVRSKNNLKVLVTSRPIEDLKEKNEIDKNFARYQVLPLSTKQLLTFIEKACDNPAAMERLTAGIERSVLFRNLPKTPISAILLARILKEDPTELPSTMTELYSKYSELVLGRWDVSKGLQSQKEYEIIDSVCTNLGSYIIEHGLNEISSKEAQDFFTRYIKERNLKISSDLIYEKFLTKTEIINYSNRYCTINFKHRTFAEYFSAKKLLRDNTAVINDKVYDPYWCTVFFFFVGLKRDCPELIDALTNVETKNTQQRINRIFQMAQYLLAGHLTPYKNIRVALKKTYSIAAELLHEGLSGHSPLSAFPPMQLIYILSYGICNAYGYEYFNDAIQESMLDNLGKDLSEVEVLELFLLSSTSAYLGKNHAFDELINEHGKNLPETLKLGIRHFNDDFSLKSDVTAKYIKKLDKNFRARTNFQELIAHLYDTPISKNAESLEAAENS